MDFQHVLDFPAWTPETPGREGHLEEGKATPVFLSGESRGPRSLVGCCLVGRKELNTTEAA